MCAQIGESRRTVSRRRRMPADTELPAATGGRVQRRLLLLAQVTGRMRMPRRGTRLSEMRTQSLSGGNAGQCPTGGFDERRKNVLLAMNFVTVRDGLPAFFLRVEADSTRLGTLAHHCCPSPLDRFRRALSQHMLQLLLLSQTPRDADLS